jgi:hypothetical protein
MEYSLKDRDTVCLVVTDRELLALKGGLMEADEAIHDDMAFSARLGVPREEVEKPRTELVAARRLLFR